MYWRIESARPWTPIERNDASFMDHLVGNRDDSGRLDDPVGITVVGWHHRSRQAARDAAIGTGFYPRTVGGSTATPPRGSQRRARGRGLLSLRRHRRDFAVRRIDHEPRTAASIGLEPVVEGRGATEIAGNGIASAEWRVQQDFHGSLSHELA